MPNIHLLTPKEKQVLDSLIRHGFGKVVAYEMGVSPQTVKNHMTSILNKTGHSRALQAVVEYDRWRRMSDWPAVERRTGYERRVRERRSNSDRRTRI